MKVIDAILRIFAGGRVSEHNEQPTAESRSWTIGNSGALHPYEVTPDHPAADIIAGMEFCATFQVRTPLRILRRHGQILPLGSELPHDFEPWMGIWIAKPKSWRDLGIDADELVQIVASAAGPVAVTDYLPFLIAVREVVENTEGSIDERIERLQVVSTRTEFSSYVAAEGGADAMCGRFFPPIISLIPGLSRRAQSALMQMDVSTVGSLRRAPDEMLLGIQDIGRVKLKAIRWFCEQYAGDAAMERAVNVVR